MPKFSVITCTYNSEKYLQKNIESVLAQNYKDFEHLFIDAHSQDKTLNIIKKYYHKPPIYSFPPQGIAHAMNQGIEKAQGEYLIHLHADDSFYDQAVLSDVAQFLAQENNPDWIYGQASFIDENDAPIGIFPTRRILKKHNYLLLCYYNYIPHQATFIKKEVFSRYGPFSVAYKNCMDYDFWLRIGKGVTPVFFERIISNYRKHEDAQTFKVPFNKTREEKNQIRTRHHLGSFICKSAVWTDYLIHLYSKFIVLRNNR